MSNVKNIDAKQLKTWLESGEAVLVDVREPNEFTEWRIPQAISMPLTNIDKNLDHLADEKRKIVFQCLKGKRGEMGATSAMELLPDKEIYNLTGGIEAWNDAGFSITRDNDKAGATISLNRQVFITAGSMILLFSLFAVMGWKVGSFLTLFMGAGLLYAGASGNCMMANVLQKMPWNQVK